ncbi:hypothetical protein QFC20_007736 [Naganishia adeliensis]|uniref:Uncharacterized protein n=1 Tax=Naganishia adeliensis TaxID=92952 RepID=A0ACC2UVL7_9TREE|nr:hypothetical protein QFC20_007736 [Naganishia adeliensis]
MVEPFSYHCSVPLFRQLALSSSKGTIPETNGGFCLPESPNGWPQDDHHERPVYVPSSAGYWSSELTPFRLLNSISLRPHDPSSPIRAAVSRPLATTASAVKQNPEMEFLSGECLSPLFIVQTACEQGGKLFGMMRRYGLTSWSRTRMGTKLARWRETNTALQANLLSDRHFGSVVVASFIVFSGLPCYVKLIDPFPPVPFSLHDDAIASSHLPVIVLVDIVPAAVPLTTALAARKKNGKPTSCPVPREASWGYHITVHVNYGILISSSVSSTRPETLLQPRKPTTILPHPTSTHATLAQPRFPRRTGSTSEGYVQGESIGEEERSSGGGGSDWPVKRGLEAEQDADESGVAAAPVPQKKAVKAKPKARKSAAAVDPEVEAGLEKTLAEHSAKAVLLGRPKPVKKAAPAVHDLRSPSVEEAPVEVMDDDD